MSGRSYARGCLLWIDDDLNVESIRQKSSEDFWRTSLGNIDDRVYRRLGLQVLLATTGEGALRALDSIRNHSPRNASDRGQLNWSSDIYTIGVLDLSIPRRAGEQPHPRHGIDLAHCLRERGIPFYFLSAQSNALETLKKERLDAIPYHRKNFESGQPIMPEPLVRTIFNEFKNHVTWIDLAPLLDQLDHGSQIPLLMLGDPRHAHSIRPGNSSPKEARRFFPFFGSFRDFVERWEHRPVVTREQRLVLRAPQFHCDEFVMQCLLLILGDRIQTSDRFVVHYCSLTNENALRYGIEKAATLQNNGAVVFRVLPQVKESRELFRQAVAAPTGCTTVFVVPNDESAELYLEDVPGDANSIFDDLPQVRPGDITAREELIRRACGFAFQQVRLDLGDETASALGPLYSENPEILAHPLNWVALMEAEHVEEFLSDPFEVLEVFFEAANDLQRLDGGFVSSESVDIEPEDSVGAPPSRFPVGMTLKMALTQDLPIPPAHLLHLARSRIEGAGIQTGWPGHPKMLSWALRAFDNWLNTSWQFPYGLGERAFRRHFGDETFRQVWERHCLDVLVMLASLIPESALADSTDPRASGLLMAKRFLEHEDTRNLIASRGKNPILQDAEFPRWPHLRYPMPAALSRYLQDSGKYLWVQSDHLDIATGLPTGGREFHDLEAVVWMVSERVKWIDQYASLLPVGWREPARFFVDIVQRRSYHETCQERPAELMEAIQSLLHNATPVSLLFHCLVTGRPIAGVADSAEQVLKTLHGCGAAIERIRGYRRETRHRVLRPVRGATGEWRRSVARLAYSRRLLQELNRYQGSPDFLWHHVSRASMELMNQIASIAAMPQSQSEGAGADSTSDLFAAFSGWLEHPELHMGEDWWKNGTPATFLVPGLAESELKSLFGTTRAAYWWILDLLQEIRFATMPFRAYDGYLLLAILNDLRVENKAVPKFLGNADLLSVVLEAFLLGFEGLVAQLKFVLEEIGGQAAEAARGIALQNIELLRPVEYMPPKPSHLSSVVRWQRTPDGSGLFVLGIPGKPDRLTIHHQGTLV